MKKGSVYGNLGSISKSETTLIDLSKLLQQAKPEKEVRVKSPLFNKARRKYKVLNPGQKNIIKQMPVLPVIDNIKLQVPDTSKSVSLLNSGRSSKGKKTGKKGPYGLPKCPSSVSLLPVNIPQLAQAEVKKALSPQKKRRRSFGLSSDSRLVAMFNKDLIQNYGITKAGRELDGDEKTNQDSYIILPKIFDLDFYIFAVLDGHGDDGHYVSDYCKTEIEKYFTNQSNFVTKKSNILRLTEDIIYNRLIINNYKLIKSFFQNLQNSLLKQDFDTQFSGTTCNIIFKIKSRMLCANVGDSRAVLYTAKNNGLSFTYKTISTDHKPKLEKEKKRIIEKGGLVAAFKHSQGDPDGPLRVWAKDDHTPGLAISRSLGDSDVHKIGVISEPEIIEMSLFRENKLILMASDGLWDALTQEDTCTLLKKHIKEFDASAICSLMVDNALQKWDEEGEDAGRDDITCIAVVINTLIG